MDENKNTTVDTGIDTVNNTENSVTETTYTQSDLDAKIQSETDRVRTKYVRQLKDLQAKIDELSPATKTEEQLKFEKQLADFGAKQKEIEVKELFINLQSSLQSRNIDVAFADYLKSNIDVEKFESVINQVISNRIKASGYVPTSHESNPSITREEWNALGYYKQTELFKSNPELAKSFM